jgi:hypothetical protein
VNPLSALLPALQGLSQALVLYPIGLSLLWVVNWPALELALRMAPALATGAPTVSKAHR